MENKQQLRYLLERYLAGNETQKEQKQLFKALKEEDNTREWELLLKQFAEDQASDVNYKTDRWDAMITDILQHHDPQSKTKSNGLLKWFTRSRVAAAAIILLIATGAWYGFGHLSRRKPDAAGKIVSTAHDIRPGGNKATLTLSNGSAIILDSARNGMLARQGASQVSKLSNGLLAYHTAAQKPGKVAYNTITTPRGGQYRLVLSDGTKVWLNAASSLTFPTAFTGKNRAVTLKGEAYFEVTHHQDRPFRVMAGGIEVEDVGTHFNVNAYGDDAVLKTTLLEGAVKVLAGDASTLVTAGQQAVVHKGPPVKLISDIDVSEAVAWKNGLFEFTDAGVADIMRQISRWYDVKIIYDNGIPPGHITGKIPRNTNLSQVLEMMQLSGIHFKMEGRKLIVLSK